MGRSIRWGLPWGWRGKSYKKFSSFPVVRIRHEQDAESDLHAKLAEFGDFVTAARGQARYQFSPGTVEREIIGAIRLVNNTGGGGRPPPPASAAVAGTAG